MPSVAHQTPTTPRVSNFPRVHADLPTGLRAKSPSGDRASALSQKGVRKDTRPLKEKDYQRKMLVRINTYFKKFNEPEVLKIKNGSIEPTTIAIFLNLTTVLLEDIGMIVKPALVQANYVEEIPKYMNKLHYPGATSKAFLKSVNVLHALPDVLGWLSWLVELADTRAIAAQRFDSIDSLPFIDTPENPATIQRTLFKTLLQLYGNWNSASQVEKEARGEEDDVKKKILADYEDTIAQYYGATPEALAAAQAELKETLAKEKAIDEEAARVDKIYDEAVARLAALKKEEAEDLAYLEERERYKEKIKKELEEMDREEAQLALEREQLEAECRELDLQLKLQEMSADERDEYEQKCKELKNQSKQFDEHLEEVKKEVYSQEIRLAKANDRLSKAILSYNRSVVFDLPENIMGKKLSELQMPESFSFDENIFDIVKEKAKIMNDWRAQMIDENKKLEPLIKASANKLEGLQEKLKIIKQEKLELNAQNQEAKERIKQFKLQANEEEAKLQKQIKKLEEEIKEIRDATPNLDPLNAQLEEVNEKIKAREKKKAFYEQSAERFFGRFYETLTHHTNEVKKILSKFNEFEEGSSK